MCDKLSLSTLCQPFAALAIVTHLDVLEDNTATTLVLEFHQLLSMFTLLIRRVLEELVEAWQCYIIPVKVVGLQTVKAVMYIACMHNNYLSCISDTCIEYHTFSLHLPTLLLDCSVSR